MLKKHIVLFESKDYGWVAYSTIASDAKRILNVNNQYNIFYVFECDLLKQYPYTMKLKAPLNENYNCKKINKYKEETFDLGNLTGRWYIQKLEPYYEGMNYTAIINGIKNKVYITPESYKNTTIKFF